MSDRPTNAEEAMALALDWAEGNRSWTNFGPYPPYTPDVIAVMDAQEVVKWTAIATAMRAVPEQDEAVTAHWYKLPFLVKLATNFERTVRDEAEELVWKMGEQIRETERERDALREALELARPYVQNSRRSYAAELDERIERALGQSLRSKSPTDPDTQRWETP